MTIAQLCRSLGLSREIQKEAEEKLSSLGINLNSPNDVRRGIASLFGRVKPFVGLALPLLKKISPSIKDATGYSVDELYAELGGVTSGKEIRKSAESDLYGKYKNL